MKSVQLKKVVLSSITILSLVSSPIVNTAFADTTPSTTSSSSPSSSSSSASSSSQASNQSTSSSSSSNSADNSSHQTHTLTHSYVVYGSGASDTQQLNSVLAVDNSFKVLTADANAYKQFINPNGSTTNAAMISSVAIVPTDPGSGIKVNVKKFNGQNVITKVTAQQYAMVAQMAGVTDVTITVSANTPVSGESALTGVYEAIQADGVQLNSQNTQSANQMLGATNDTIQANKDNDKYPGKLMAAIGDTTKAINAQQQKGDTPSTDDIQTMLNHRLFLHGIYGSTKDHEQPIVNALVQFNHSPISKSSDYSSHVSDTINNVKHSSGDVMNQAKQFMGSKEGKQAQQQAQSWWDQLVQWIQGVINGDK